ncbi:PREDICTED: G-type lectin S-receptor [Prunus dulcis]|uniref:non-specific serine/threonine protein kinase n=1 Tax=Prunus dulcis TaxID=3755 RepID=A0A5E4GDG0_PRUDU|nr:PREDICTED: G-type lectin S-receptor [Prunus dulcis]
MASHVISAGQSLSGNQTITSPSGIFELGFFTPGNSQNYYIGIWYKKPSPQTVVWVANRNQPVSDTSSSTLQLFQNGNLTLLVQSKTEIWSTHSMSTFSHSTVAMLLDNGNFVITDAFNSSVVIWQSFDHPTDTWLPGGKLGHNKLTKEKLSLTPWRNPQNPAPGLFSFELEQNGTSFWLFWNGSKTYWTSGYWTGKIFSLVPETAANDYIASFTFASNENGSYFTYASAYNDTFIRFMLEITGQIKFYVWGKGFTQWTLIWMRPNEQCDAYATCGAFSICNQQNASLCGCLPGFEPKVPKVWKLKDHSNGCLRKTPLQCNDVRNSTFLVIHDVLHPVNSESLTVENIEKCRLYRDLRRATKNFSEKLGEGAFGSVFKGVLPDSTAIAVKELKSLNQGEKQFRNEVRTIGSIQHINLVRLWGFCAEASKRILVYDYMPNGSLQSLLFQKNPIILDWKARYNIAIGTARGLAYLHEDCRERIIHCDIKPENILLDAEYSPKLGDFGLAKLIGRQNSRVLTTMRGTVGYLAPEWFSGEAITPKADVFSYGMLLIEIISGRRNRQGLDEGLESFFPIQVTNIVTKGEDVVTLLDYKLEGQADKDELTRACKVACWCIQDDEKDRPKMREVVQILQGVSDVGIPPIPRFLQRLNENPIEATSSQETICTSNSSA